MSGAVAARAILSLAAAASLVAGLSGGMARLGIGPAPSSFAEFHGALMICGFFGTLISLERAAADGRGICLIVPGLAASGAVLLGLGREVPGGVAILLAGIGLALLTARAAIRLPTLFTAIMTAAALLWPSGTILWLAGRSISQVSYFWLGFLVLTIVAERIELSRLARPGAGAQALLVLMVALFIGALAMGQPWTGTGWLAATLAGIASWLLAYDIALKTVRTRGLARFSAMCLLSGYGWLLVAAASMVLHPPGLTAFGHDAVLHAVGIGFILSMVFAHAPIILPAVAGVPVHYVPALYGPAALLQLAVALRLSGDLAGAAGTGQLAAWLVVAAIATYALTLISTALPRLRRA